MVSKLVFGGLLVLGPAIASAQTLNDIFNVVGGWIGPLTALLVGFAMVYFIFGVIKFITAGDDAEKKSQARGTMIYGIIALAVIVAAWGLVRVLLDTFSVNETETFDEPYTPPVTF